MSRARRKNPLTGFEDLVAQWEGGKPQPKELPSHLKVAAIKVREEVFQHRRPEAHASNAHIRDLAEKAKSRDLNPVTVWWDGKKWTLVDGHHRTKAYIRAGKGQQMVPVRVFEGTPEQALAEAAGGNTKNTLPMSKSEKANAAWRLVVLGGGLSKADQAQQADVSERLVAMMRKSKTILRGDLKQPPELLAEMSWQNARRYAAGDTGEWSPEEEEVRVEKMTLALRKALGATADKQPDIFRQALERFSPRLAQALEEGYLEAFKEAQADT